MKSKEQTITDFLKGWAKANKTAFEKQDMKKQYLKRTKKYKNGTTKRPNEQ